MTEIKSNIPKIRFKDFSGEWEEKKLGEVANIITGSTPSTNNKLYYNGDFLFVSPADIQGQRYINKTNTTLTELGFTKGRFIKKGSILFVCIGSTIGKVGQAGKDCITNQQINSLISNEFNDDNFLFSLLSLNGNKIKLLAGVQAVPQINKTDFSNLKYLFPSLSEQEKIASFLSSVDKKIENIKEKKKNLEEYKKGVLQKIFSKELRFKDKNGEEFGEWEEVRLGDIATFSKGKGLSKSDIVKNGKNKCIHYGELFTKYGPKIKIIFSSTDLEGNLVLSKGNEILMPTSDVTPNGLATGSAILEKNVILGGDILIFSSDKINNVFFSYYIKGHRKDIMRLVSGSTVFHLYGSDMKTLKINFPSLQEQEKIANFLMYIDNKIEKVSEELEKNEEFKKGLLQGMFV